MIHYITGPDEFRQQHYAVNDNDRGMILVQVDNGYEQARIVLSIDQTEHMIVLLQQSIERAKTSKIS